jgi:hypothetical protein
MLGPATRLQNHFRSWQLLEKSVQLITLELPPQHRPLLLIHTVDRENMLGRISRNALKLHPGRPFVGSQQLKFCHMMPLGRIHQHILNRAGILKAIQPKNIVLQSMIASG